MSPRFARAAALFAGLFAASHAAAEAVRAESAELAADGRTVDLVFRAPPGLAMQSRPLLAVEVSLAYQTRAASVVETRALRLSDAAPAGRGLFAVKVALENVADAAGGLDVEVAWLGPIVDQGCDGACSGHGLCVHGLCFCEPGFTGADCGEVVSSCPQDCSGHGLCSHGVCFCDPGYAGGDCAGEVAACPGGCSGHGACLHGLCFCEAGWSGADCSVGR